MQFDIRSNPPPDKIYFDTSFLITALIETPSEKNKYKIARSFLDRIINKQPQVFTSLLTEIEFIESCVYLALSTKVGKSVKLAVKADPNLFVKHKAAIDKYIDRFKWVKEKLAGKWQELAIDRQVIKLARRFGQDYNLMFRDAIHLASARLMICDNIISFDKDFSNIKSINQYTLLTQV